MLRHATTGSSFIRLVHQRNVIRLSTSTSYLYPALWRLKWRVPKLYEALWWCDKVNKLFQWSIIMTEAPVSFLFVATFTSLTSRRLTPVCRSRKEQHLDLNGVLSATRCERMQCATFPIRRLIDHPPYTLNQQMKWCTWKIVIDDMTLNSLFDQLWMSEASGLHEPTTPAPGSSQKTRWVSELKSTTSVVGRTRFEAANMTVRDEPDKSDRSILALLGSASVQYK